MKSGKLADFIKRKKFFGVCGTLRKRTSKRWLLLLLPKARGIAEARKQKNKPSRKSMVGELG